MSPFHFQKISTVCILLTFKNSILKPFLQKDLQYSFFCEFIHNLKDPDLNFTGSLTISASWYFCYLIKHNYLYQIHAEMALFLLFSLGHRRLDWRWSFHCYSNIYSFWFSLLIVIISHGLNNNQIKLGSRFQLSSNFFFKCYHSEKKDILHPWR